MKGQPSLVTPAKNQAYVSLEMNRCVLLERELAGLSCHHRLQIRDTPVSIGPIPSDGGRPLQANEPVLARTVFSELTHLIGPPYED